MSGGIAPRILNLVSKMKVSGQRHIPPRESHRYPLDRADLEEPVGSSETLEFVYQTERRHSPVYRILENYLPLPGTEYQSPGRLTRSVVTILTELHLQLYNRNFYKPHRRPPKNVCCHCSF
jgi:hypothetical protein